MIEGHRIIAFTPAGRKRYMDILLVYVERSVKAGVVDEWVLFNNTYTAADQDYVRALPAKYPWIRVFEESAQQRDYRNIHKFYKQFTDPNAVYVRLDDDICFIDESAIELLVLERLRNPQPFLLYPLILGNTRIAHHMQKAGKLPEAWGKIEDNIFDGVAYSAEYIVKLHNVVIESIALGSVLPDFAIENVMLPSHDIPGLASPPSHVSVNAFAMLGKDMMEMKDSMGEEEERYQSIYRPQQLGRPNAICGASIMVHFAYHTQMEAAEKAGFLPKYKVLATW